MRTPLRVGGFVLALGAVFGLAVLVGRVAGPDREEPVAHEMAMEDDAMDDHAGAGAHAGHTETAPAGLSATQEGYTLALAADRAKPGTRQLAFTVSDRDGHPVTHYDVQHEKRLHLIAVRRDATGFQHVHPTLAADGTWSTSLDLTPGAWRVYADFKPTGGDAMTLGADLLVAGDFAPAAARPDSPTATVDGYTVTLDGDLEAGSDTVLTPRVTKDGRDVTAELEPYLGALGHLVALRRSDLAYLHVHPEGLDFHTSVPTAGAYELFLDFQHEGVVRTAHFTLTAGGGHVH
jgi:hypothetical protein